MQVDQALSSGDANGAHEGDEEEVWPLVEFELMEGLPPIAVATELSRYDAVPGLPHPPTASLGEDEDAGSTDEGKGKRQRTATSPTSAIAFGMRAPDTVLEVDSADNPSGRRRRQPAIVKAFS